MGSAYMVSEAERSEARAWTDAVTELGGVSPRAQAALLLWAERLAAVRAEDGAEFAAECLSEAIMGYRGSL